MIDFKKVGSVFALFVLGTLGCSDEAESDCQSGESRACECSEGVEGVQVCSDGQFGACDCSTEGDAGSDLGSDQSVDDLVGDLADETTVDLVDDAVDLVDDGDFSTAEGLIDNTDTNDVVPLGPCDIPEGMEPEPNDDRDHPTSYVIGESFTGCLADDADRDFFAFQVTDPYPAGGYVQFHVVDVGNGNAEMIIRSSADNGTIIDGYNLDRGASFSMYFGAKVDTQFYVEVKPWITEWTPFRYTLTSSWTRVEDAHEPNDGPGELAADINLATGTSNEDPPSATAYLFAGYDDSQHLVRADFDDWYHVTLAAGTVRVRVSDVPEDIRVSGLIEDATGTDLASGYQADPGADLTLEGTATAGEHYVQVTVWLTEDAKGRGTDLPDFFTQPYELRVTQAAE